MKKGSLLLSVVLSAREADTAAATTSSTAAVDSANDDGGITPFGCVNVARSAVDANSVGELAPSLSEQLTQMQQFYKDHGLSEASADRQGALLQLRLGDTGPSEEVLGYYEGAGLCQTTDNAAAPPLAVASLFSCPELIYLQNPAPITEHSPRAAPEADGNNFHARQMGHRWQSLFQAPLTVFDDRYGATNFWQCLQQILYKGAFGFDSIEGERYGVQLQGVAVPVVEVDENFTVMADGTDAESGGCCAATAAAAAAAAAAAETGEEVTGWGKMRPATAEGKAFDLFHFFSNVDQSAVENSAEELTTARREKHRAAKCHIADAQDLRDVTRYLESFHAQIEEREGPAHLILYVTFVDANDARNRRSLCLLRLDDVSLAQQLSPNEFRVAEVLEMLVEELALALNADASPTVVFDEDEGVELALDCSHLTMILRKVLRRNYERVAKGVEPEESDFITHLHWLFNLPEGVQDVANSDESIIRVKYADPVVAARISQAMELIVEFQEINVECATTQTGTTEDPQENSLTDVPVVEKEIPRLTIVEEESEENPCVMIADFSPSYRPPTTTAPARRRSVVCESERNAAVADESPFAFNAAQTPTGGGNAADCEVSDALWNAAIVSEGKNRSPLADCEATLAQSVGKSELHTRLPLCRMRSRVTTYMEATPMTIDLPVEQPSTPSGLPNLLHKQMGIAANIQWRKRHTVHEIGEMLRGNRRKRCQRRELTVFTLV